MQPEGKEIMDCMSAAVNEHILNFKKVEKKLPKHVLFYRDGVGEN